MRGRLHSDVSRLDAMKIEGLAGRGDRVDGCCILGWHPKTDMNYMKTTWLECSGSLVSRPLGAFESHKIHGKIARNAQWPPVANIC